VANRATLEIIETGADDHAAVRSWRAFSGERGGFDHIDILKETHKTAVYRLHPATPGSPTVIAKRRLHDAIAHERMIYERVLSTLPVSSLACYGSLAGDADTSWIFLEDSGGIELSYKSEAHMAAATRWLACVHVATSARPELSELDDRGHRHYLGHLRGARQTLERHVHNPALDVDEVALLRRMLSLLDSVEEQWPELEAFSAALPQAFTHGDFVQKNVHVRELPGELVVVPLDWETSGWGVPASDLTRVDLRCYWQLARDAWPGITLADAQRMVTLGTVFRLLAAISWEAPSFRASWVKRAAMKMALYSERLASAMSAWERS
jgi:hypothetical protein